MPTPLFHFGTDHTGAPAIRFMGWSYKAPHANRSTPKKMRRRPSSVLYPSLFKGHRP